LPHIVALMRLTLPCESHRVLAMRRFGFTLIELLVIIAILALLLVILMPALTKSRLQAKAVVCMSNIKQLSTTFSVYVTDSTKFPYGFDDTPAWPPPGGYVGDIRFREDKAGWWWFNYLKDIYKKNMGFKTVLRCPSRQIQNPKFKNNILRGNYGANLSVCRMSGGGSDPNERGQPRLGSEVSRPAQTLLIVDSGYAIISWRHAADSFTSILGNEYVEDTAYVPGLSINRQRQLRPEQITDAVYGRHPQMMVNVGFADGHVARIKAEDLLVLQKPDGRYENRSPLWVPDSK
jgi:prepilin-type processing-associated H-X9-DG protein